MVTWTDAVRDDNPAQARDDDGGEALAALLTKAISADAVPSAAIGHLVGLLRGGLPLVMVSIEDAHAMPARSIVDLYGAHVGRQVVLHFEGGDRSKPIVMGVLRNDDAELLPPTAAQVQVDADGERLIVVAKDLTEDQELRSCSSTGVWPAGRPAEDTEDTVQHRGTEQRRTNREERFDGRAAQRPDRRG